MVEETRKNQSAYIYLKILTFLCHQKIWILKNIEKKTNWQVTTLYSLWLKCNLDEFTWKINIYPAVQTHEMFDIFSLLLAMYSRLTFIISKKFIYSITFGFFAFLLNVKSIIVDRLLYLLKMFDFNVSAPKYDGNVQLIILFCL